MNLEVVLADGRIINTAGEGRRTRYVDLNVNFNCRIIKRVHYLHVSARWS